MVSVQKPDRTFIPNLRAISRPPRRVWERWCMPVTSDSRRPHSVGVTECGHREPEQCRARSVYWERRSGQADSLGRRTPTCRMAAQILAELGPRDLPHARRHSADHNHHTRSSHSRCRAHRAPPRTSASSPSPSSIQAQGCSSSAQRDPGRTGSTETVNGRHSLPA